MLVRYREARERVEQDSAEALQTQHFMSADDEAGFSLHEMTFQPGATSQLWHQDSLAAVFVTEGEGEITQDETGETHTLRPGVVCVLNAHEHPHIHPSTELRAVCVFNPPTVKH